MFTEETRENVSRFALFNHIVKISTSGELGEFQKEMLHEFSRSIRKCDVEQLIRYKAFIVLDNNYLASITYDKFEDTILNPKYDLYHGDYCKFNKRLMIPLSGFDGNVHGFVGYDKPEEKETDVAESDEDDDMRLKNDFLFYLYQSDLVFKKSKYLFITRDEYIEAIKRGYIFIVDGVFDKISVSGINEPCCAVLSSSFSKYHAEYLKFIKNWIVLADNDSAGARLLNKCQGYNKNTVRMSFKDCKDIDEKLMSDKLNKDKFSKALKEIKSTSFLLNVGLDSSNLTNVLNINQIHYLPNIIK